MNKLFSLGFLLVILFLLPSFGFFLALNGLDFIEISALFKEVLPSVKTTLFLSVLSSVGSILIGSSLFWLINFHQFTGVRIFKYIIFLPILIPIYIAGYAYAHFFEYNPLCSAIYSALGIKFINLRSLGGASFVFVLMLYPYIYLLSNSIFKKIESSIIISKCC